MHASEQAMTRNQATTRSNRSFTLAEVIVAIFVIFLLMGIALVSYRSAANQARLASDRALVSGLKIAVEDFKREFGFIPPLVKDGGSDGNSPPLIMVEGLVIPSVFSPVLANDLRVLRAEIDDIPRYSNFSLAYYLMGALDAKVDGIDGPGFVEVRRTGNFAPVVDPKTINAGDRGTLELARRGPKKYEPMFDTDRGGVELFIDTANRVMITGQGGGLSPNRLVYRAEIRDRNGIAVRYYRWTPDDVDPASIAGGVTSYTDDAADFPTSVSGLIAYLNIPKVVLHAYGDPLDPLFEVPHELREATFAIVAAGPNKLFGDLTEDELRSDPALLKRYAENLGLSLTRLQSDQQYREKAIEDARSDNIVEVGS